MGTSCRVESATRAVKRRRLIQDQVRLHDDQIAELVGLYRDGSSVRELAARFRINRKTVSIHLERCGVPRRVVQAKLSADDIRRAAELYRSGLSLVSVGEDLGVNAKTASKALHRVGVTMRPRQGGLPEAMPAATTASEDSSTS